VFDFEPNPAFDMKNAKSMLQFFGKTAGVMWIDEKDKQVARIEAVLAQSLSIGGGVLAKLKKGATFTLEKERIGDEIWLPSLAEINLSVRVLLVKGINVNQLVRYYDYHRFETEVKDAKIDEKAALVLDENVDRLTVAPDADGLALETAPDGARRVDGLTIDGFDHVAGLETRATCRSVRNGRANLQSRSIERRTRTRTA